MSSPTKPNPLFTIVGGIVFSSLQVWLLAKFRSEQKKVENGKKDKNKYDWVVEVIFWVVVVELALYVLLLGSMSLNSHRVEATSSHRSS